MTTDYRAIYDRVTSELAIYNLAQNSPGYQACLLAKDLLAGVSGPALDVGCGVGFAVELLASVMFRYEAWGVDVSEVAVARARERTRGVLPPERFGVTAPGELPFADGTFGLVTSFDVLEHLDEADVRRTLGEMDRVLRAGGLLLCTVSTRPAGSEDAFGDNLHRTVRDACWWIELVRPDEALVRRRMEDVMLWRRKREGRREGQRGRGSAPQHDRDRTL